MKRIICIILLIALSFVLCSCRVTNEDTFPQVRIMPSIYRMDNIYIPLRANHTFTINHLYDEVETEDGYDIVIHIKAAPGI